MLEEEGEMEVDHWLDEWWSESEVQAAAKERAKQ